MAIYFCFSVASFSEEKKMTVSGLWFWRPVKLVRSPQDESHNQNSSIPDQDASHQTTSNKASSQLRTQHSQTKMRILLVNWCFEPSQPQRITSGLNTKFALSPSYSFLESSYHKLCFLSLFIFRGHSTREPASGRVTCFLLRAYTGTMC